MEPKTPYPAEDTHVSRPHQSPLRPAASASVAEVPSSPDSSTGSVTEAAKDLVLPPSVISKSDVSRGLRELSEIDDYFHQASIRGSKDQEMPSVSKVLEVTAEANGLNLIHADDRSKLKTFLTGVKAGAPVVHISFPSEASNQFLGKLLDWFRTEVHPYTLMRVGLKPELIAGFMLRTNNKSFDFSFRKRFERSKQKLIDAISESNKTHAADQDQGQLVEPATPTEAQVAVDRPLDEGAPQPLTDASEDKPVEVAS